MTEIPDAAMDRRDEDEPAGESLADDIARETDGDIEGLGTEREDPQ